MRGSLSSGRGFLLAASLLGVLAFPLFAQAGTIDVTSIGSAGWNTFDQQSTGTASFVSGPGTAPVGIGSLQLTTGAGSGTQGGYFELGTTAYNNLTLSQITSMSYDTYVANRLPGTDVAPVLHIYLTDNALLHSYVNLVYEPVYSPTQQTTQTGQWQHWDAYNGLWWSTNPDLGAQNPPTGSKNLAGWATALQNATIIGISISAGQHAPGGTWPGFQGNVDNLTIGTSSGTTTFNFDPPVPEPTSLVVWGTLALAGVTIRKVRRARKA